VPLPDAMARDPDANWVAGGNRHPALRRERHRRADAGGRRHGRLRGLSVEDFDRQAELGLERGAAEIASTLKRLDLARMLIG
jgi:hypothetical protein